MISSLKHRAKVSTSSYESLHFFFFFLRLSECSEGRHVERKVFRSAGGLVVSQASWSFKKTLRPRLKPQGSLHTAENFLWRLNSTKLKLALSYLIQAIAVSTTRGRHSQSTKKKSQKHDPCQDQLTSAVNRTGRLWLSLENNRTPLIIQLLKKCTKHSNKIMVQKEKNLKHDV